MGNLLNATGHAQWLHSGLWYSLQCDPLWGVLNASSGPINARIIASVYEHDTDQSFWRWPSAVRICAIPCYISIVAII